MRIVFLVGTRILNSALAWLSLILAIFPYLYFTFLNVDPVHDGWFSTPAAALAEGGVPYRDVVTSYGWFTPALLGLIIKIFGFQLLYFRLIGLFFLFGICVLFIILLQRSIGLNKSLLVVSIWLMIGLGQMTKDPQALPAWGLWPNQFIVLGSLLLIFFLIRNDDFNYSTLTIIGLIAGLAPWVRAQGILILASVLFVFTVRIYQSNSPNKLLKILQLISVSFTVFIAPFIYLLNTGALDEWFWQTIEMPRTGEWIGMPQPAAWVIQNLGLAILLTFALFITSNVLRLLKVSGKKLVIFFAPFLIFISVFPFPKTPLEGSIVIRKVHSLLYLYSNYHFFTLPVLVILSATLFLVLMILQKTFITRGRFLVEMPSLVAILGIPALTLVYYNFGHLWGVAPLLVLSILYFWKSKIDSSSHFGHFRQVVTVYSLLVSLIAAPQVYLNLAKPTFSYDSPGLVGMRGQDIDQVGEVRSVIESLAQLPKGNKVFFLCKNAFYSTLNTRYLSDNIFYSTSMTRFDRRVLSQRVPAPDTKYVLYCQGSNTPPVSDLPGNWKLSEITVSSTTSGLQIYERG